MTRKKKKVEGIFIPNLRVPKGCGLCRLSYELDRFSTTMHCCLCNHSFTYDDIERYEHCPLIETEVELEYEK